MARTLNYHNGEKIIEAGKVEQRMFIILEGSVDILLSDGKSVITVATLGKGDFFGEISLFNQSPRSATVVAHGDVHLAYIDSREQLKSFLMVNPAFAVNP